MSIVRFVLKYSKLSVFLKYIFLCLSLWMISMYLPLVNGELIDILTKREMSEKLYLILFVLAFFSLVKVWFSYYSNVIYTKLYTRTSFDISYLVFNHIKKMPIDFFYNKNSGYINQRINSDSSVISEFVLLKITNLILNFISMILSGIILFFINYKIGIILIVLIPLYIALYFMFKKRLYNLNYSYKEMQSNYYGEINSQLENVRLAKINVLYDLFNKKTRDAFEILFESAVKLTKGSSLFSNIGMLITVIANIFILIIGSYQIINGYITIGQFTIIGTYFNTILVSVDSFLQFLDGYQNALVSYNRLKDILNCRKEINGSKFIDEVSEIKLENVCYTYNDNTRVIKNLSCTFEKGYIYKIVGSNGAGKSTLINIISGLYDTVESGRVRYNGIDLNEVDMYSVRKNLIGIVEQEPMLLKDTILNNMTYNSSEYNINYLASLIKKLGLESFIEKQDIGLNSNIENDACNISGGEKQKISLIRSLIKDPHVLILDEVNSALDVDAIHRLVKVMEEIKKNKIIIIIAHNSIFDSIVDEVIDL